MTELSQAALEEAYTQAMLGSDEPNLIITTPLTVKQTCFHFGMFQWWFDFVKVSLRDSLSTRRLNPWRLPE